MDLIINKLKNMIMKPKIRSRIGTTAITLATAVSFLGVPYGSALAQDPRVDNGLRSTMGYLAKIPEQPVLGEGLDNFLAGRLNESENPVYEIRGKPSTGVTEAVCITIDANGDIFLGGEYGPGNCR